MSKQILFLILFLCCFLNAAAQTPEEAYAVKNSTLSVINLPTGALRVRAQSVPGEIKTTLAKTINLNAGSSVGTSSCEAKNNFKQAMPAATVTKKFVIKRMDSITRPDNPWQMCFESDGGETCFEKAWN